MKYRLELSDNHYCDYVLEQSSRAKYLRIKISPAGDVKVVVPSKAKNQLAHDFLLQKKSWVDKHLKAIRENPPAEIALPEVLSLPLVNEKWKLHYQQTTSQSIKLQPDYALSCLKIVGNTSDTDLVFSVLKKWLKNHAKDIFPRLLSELAAKHGFRYNRLTIRGQKTRWGSCSSKQNINLNYKLLFFPEAVVCYVMIHELCHTREMNHSVRFWNLVSQCDPEYLQHRKHLKQANAYVPAGL